MVTCNVEHFLPEAIESILGQTFRDFEFIIVDYGSTDKSKAISAKYAAADNRIKLHNTVHCGLSEARKTACSLVRGRYIAIMDADDVSLPDRLASEVEFMEKHPEVGLLGGSAEWIDAKGRPLWVYDFPLEDKEIKAVIQTRNPFCHSTVLMRTDACEQVLGYRRVFTHSHDYDLWLRISEQFQCANLPQIVLQYRLHPRQISLTRRRKQTLCRLAAEASALSRKTGRTDVLATAYEIDSALLVSLGIPEATQSERVSEEQEWWIGTISRAGEYRLARKASLAILRSSGKRATRLRMADFHFEASKFNWEKKRYWRSFKAAWNAILIQPSFVGAFFRALLRRLGVNLDEKKKGSIQEAKVKTIQSSDRR
jgi:glycosyltransferase involved in cell wall biosynthesis